MNFVMKKEINPNLLMCNQSLSGASVKQYGKLSLAEGLSRVRILSYRQTISYTKLYDSVMEVN